MAAAVQVPEREVLKCAKCSLVQYKRASGKCPRCLSPYVPTPAPQTAVQIESPVPPDLPGPSCPALSELFGSNFRHLRQQCGLSQSKLGAKIGMQRTYICKIENGMLPSLAQLPRLARGLDVSIGTLIPELNQSKISEDDQFISELAGLAHSFTNSQRAEVIEYVRILLWPKVSHVERADLRLSTQNWRRSVVA